MRDLELLRRSIKKNTKIVWIETPSNPLLRIFDIQAIVAICKEFGVITVCDNTFMSPYFQKPLDLGVDIVVHSATKYFGGHSDVVMGMIMTNNEEYYTKIDFRLFIMGITSSPFDCYLALRSLKTLRIRMEQIGKSAIAVAKFLETHELVQKVNYPMLDSHKDSDIHKRQATGGGGIVSFEIKHGTVKRCSTFLTSLNVFTIAESLGGGDSFAT